MTESSSSPRRTPTRRPPGRNGAGRGSSSPLVELASIETPPELILFNAYLSAEKDLERERQRVRQAEVAKDKAAARLKEAQEGGSRDAITEAEAEYRLRVEEWKRARDGEPAGGSDEATSGEDADADADVAAADEVEDGSAVETADEASADDAVEEVEVEAVIGEGAGEVVVEVVAETPADGPAETPVETPADEPEVVAESVDPTPDDEGS